MCVANVDMCKDDSPLYLFETSVDENALIRQLNDDYEVPDIFPHDWLGLVNQDSRPPYRWFCIGHSSCRDQSIGEDTSRDQVLLSVPYQVREYQLGVHMQQKRDRVNHHSASSVIAGRGIFSFHAKRSESTKDYGMNWGWVVVRFEVLSEAQSDLGRLCTQIHWEQQHGTWY
eukprot:5822928-Amphidinium_carterae.1